MIKMLLSVMNLEPLKLEDVIATYDGLYLGSKMGDIGFNVFLGCPNPSNIGVEASWEKFRKLAFHDRKLLVRMASSRHVDLRLFLRRKTNERTR